MPPIPSVRDVHVNRPLTNVSIAFMQDPANFFSAQVFPQVSVRNKSDQYYVWNRADFNRDEARQTAAGDEYPIGTKRLSTDSYNCQVFKYSEMIADEERANADAPLDLDQTTTECVTRKHLIRMDRQFESQYFQPGLWVGSTTGGDIVPATKWDAAAGDPIADMRPEIRSLVRKGLPRRDLGLLVTPDVWDALQDNAKFLERYENVMEANMTPALIARTLGIGRVVIGESVHNDAAEGTTSTAGIAAGDKFILERDAALLYYAPARPALNVPSAGYTFTWTGLTGAANSGMQISKIRRDERDADQIRGRSSWDNKVVAAEAAVFFDDVLT